MCTILCDANTTNLLDWFLLSTRNEFRHFDDDQSHPTSVKSLNLVPNYSKNESCPVVINNMLVSCLYYVGLANSMNLCYPCMALDRDSSGVVGYLMTANSRQTPRH